MTRESIAAAALWMFPASVREQSGEEILGSVLDAGAVSKTRFVREIAGLLGAGLRARARRTAQTPVRRLVADGLCLAAAWMLTLFLAGAIGDRIRGISPGDPSPLSWLALSIAVAALAIIFVGYDRAGGVLALAFSAVTVLGSGAHDLGDRWRAAFVVPVICFSALVLIPRPRTPNLRRLSWLMLVGLIAIASSWFNDSTAAIVIVALFTLVPIALAVLPVDPRPALAAAVCASFFGIAMAQTRGGPGPLGCGFLAATPLALALVAAAKVRPQRP
jgi:hypothetical protein